MGAQAGRTRTAPLLLAVLAAAGVAAGLRLPRLANRPMHIDEAVHTVKFDELWQHGRYDYDPHDFHGPALYYLTFPSVWLSGAATLADTDEVTFRIVPATVGVALVLAVLLLADGLGRAASAVAAAMLAVAPAFVFYSRTYIMELPLALFTLTAIGAGWRYARSRRPAWAVACGASIGLMHATKETCLIAWAAMAVALLGVLAWDRLNKNAPEPRAEARGRVAGRMTPRLLPGVLLAAAVAVLVSVALFSVFFTQWRNVPASAAAWFNYAARAGGAGGGAAHHLQPPDYYFRLLALGRPGGGLAWSQGLILILAAVGFVVALAGRGATRASPRLLRFLALYTAALAVAYSAIPYKTPWTVLTLLTGLILLAGVGAEALARRVRVRAGQAAVALFVAAGVALLGWQAWRAAFACPADPRNPYVYAQTTPDYRRLIEQVEKLAACSPAGRGLVVAVVAAPADQWPLPWGLRRFSRVGYWTEPPADGRLSAADVVITTADRVEATDRLIAASHRLIGYGELRPSVFLALYVREELWQRRAGAAGGRGAGP